MKKTKKRKKKKKKEEKRKRDLKWTPPETAPKIDFVLMRNHQKKS